MIGVSRGKTPELDSLAALLDVIKDPDAYQKRLKTLQEAAASAQEYVEAKAKLQDVDKLHEEAQEALDNANHALSVANTHATEIVDEAKSSAVDILAEAHAKESAAKYKLAQVTEFSDSKTQELTEREAKIKAEEDRIAESDKALRIREQTVEAEMAKINKHKAILAQLGD